MKKVSFTMPGAGASAAAYAGVMTRIRQAAVKSVQTRRGSFEESTFCDTVLCPADERLRSGVMEKQVTSSRTGASTESEWLPRFAVLNDRILAFTKTDAEDDVQVIDFIPLSEITTVELSRVVVGALLSGGRQKLDSSPKGGWTAIKAATAWSRAGNVSPAGITAHVRSPSIGSVASDETMSLSEADPQESEEVEYHLVIQTKADGHNSGRYVE